MVVPENVTEIGTQAFNGCSAMTSAVVKGNVTELNGTFGGCSALASVTLPDTVESMAGTFNGCSSLQAVKLPEALSEIGAETFMDCTALGHIDIPQGVKEIGDYAFTACIALDNIVLPEGLTSIGAYAFDLTVDKDGNGNFFNPDPRLASINIPSTVTSVGDNFLGGVKPDGETLLISQVPDPSIFTAGALSGVSDGYESPALYYPAEYEKEYKANTHLGGDATPAGKRRRTGLCPLAG